MMMMMRTRLRIGLLALATTMAATGPAAADEVGALGTLAGLQTFTTSADGYLAYNGQLYVRGADGTIDTYRWGGVSCGSRVLSDAEIERLQASLGIKKLYVEPVYQPGQGNARCLVGTTLVPKQSLKSVFP